MAQIECLECGTIFNDNIEDCPNCGCPASRCKKVSEEKEDNPNQESSKEQKGNSRQECSTRQEVYSNQESSTRQEIKTDGLVECKCCGAEISTEARHCPHCGAKGIYAPLDYGNAIYDCIFRKYFNTSGRSRRSEVLPFFLLCVIMWSAQAYQMPGGVQSGFVQSLEQSIGAIIILATLLPTLAATIRRLHDIGRSGWWVLTGFAGFFIFKDSDKGENEYGKSPKYQPEYFKEELPDNASTVATTIAVIVAIIIVMQIIAIFSIYASTSRGY